jgi:hypothetical protein
MDNYFLISLVSFSICDREKLQTMSEDQIRQKITELKNQLTGNLLQDGEIQQAIYDYKKELKPEIEQNPNLDDFDDEGCLMCGG